MFFYFMYAFPLTLMQYFSLIVIKQLPQDEGMAIIFIYDIPVHYIR